MIGPTLGQRPQLDHQQLFDAVQVSIAEMADDKRISGLLMDFTNGQTALRTILGELNGFADGVKEGKFSDEEIVATLKDIAEKAFRALGKMRDEDLQKKGTDYQSARWAFLKHFYAIARNFGVQVELGRLLDKWEKEYPHTQDPKEQTFQEQKEAAFKAVEAKFATMYGTVTVESGYDPDKVLEGCMKYIQEVMMGGQDGPMACFFGEAYSMKHNSAFNLSDGEKAKRADTMKAKLMPMILEAVAKDARKATKIVFDALTKEMFPNVASVRGKTASVIADEMITDVIRKRCKSNKSEHAAYKPLAYYWSNNPQTGGNVIELRHNLIYLLQNQWGPEMSRDKYVENQMVRATKRIEGDQQYFAGYTAPKLAPQAADHAAPETVREGNGAVPQTTAEVGQQLAASGEGAGIHDIATMRAQLAAKANQQSGVSVPQPSHVPAPAPQESIIIDSSIPTENPRDRKTVPEGQLPAAAPAPGAPAETDSRKVKTIPPAAPRPQRPDIKIARPDMEVTQTSVQRRAEARGKSVAKWLRRGVFAVAAALGITTAYVAVQKGGQPGQSADNKTPSSEVAKQTSVSGTPVATPTVEAPNPTASSAPSVAVAQPTASPSNSAQTGPAPTPKADTPPKTVETAKVATVLGSRSYGLGSSSSTEAPFTGTASLVEGGVDATPFAPGLKTAKWYENQKKSAELLLKIYDTNKSKLDKTTADFVAAHEKPLRDLAAQTDFTPYKFRTGFELKQKSQELYGASGIYNGLLAFERIVDLYGGDTAKLQKDAPTVKLTIGEKLMAPEQRFAKAVLLTAAADPAKNPANQGVPGGKDQPKDAPQDDNKGKTGFNDHAPGFDFDGGRTSDGLPRVAPLRYADVSPLDSDNLEVAFSALNSSDAVKATNKNEVKAYRVAREVQKHVASEDRKIVDFEQQRRSRSFFTKLSDFAGSIWSGTTPEDRAMGLRGTKGIRGFFMSDAQRQAELKQRADAIAAWESRTASVKEAPAQKVAVAPAPIVTEVKQEEAPVDLTKVSADIEASYAADVAKAAEEKRKITADLERSRLDIEASYKADLAREAAAKKAELRAQLDAKMEKLFARGKAMAAERGPAPLVDFRKTYKVAAADKSIRFVLERQIKLSDLSKEAKEKSLAVVQDMIGTNGAFIESYKMHGDGSRDLTLKEEWRDKLKEAAGIQTVTAPANSAPEEVAVLNDEDIIEVVEDQEPVKAA